MSKGGDVMRIEIVDPENCPIAPHRSSARVCTLIEDVRRGTYSRIADDVRRNLQLFRWLTRITVSQNAPAWRREADETLQSPQGLTTILAYDRSCYGEVWYKTATAGHRSKLFVRAWTIQ
ncbi:MAG: hypothetical protein QOG23_4619 [Blastocatellia bacterium]|jgi:hypothetical protein|nr:hypothetical protein [Blastocatellia bacterium]